MRSYPDANDALRGVLTDLQDNGVVSWPRGFKTSEITEYLLEISDPTRGLCTLSARKVNYSLVAFEYASYVGGCEGDPLHAQLMCEIAPAYKSFVDETAGTMNGMYGCEIAPQLPMIVDALKNDPYTRQAHLGIHSPVDLHRSVYPKYEGHQKDVPCTLGFNFRRRYRASQYKLDMTAHMRSNDVHLGATYDFAAFTLIQQTVAAFLEDKLGRYRHYTDSMHVYHEQPYKMTDVMDSMRDASDVVAIRQPDFSTIRSSCVTVERLSYHLREMVYDDLRAHLVHKKEDQSLRAAHVRKIDAKYKSIDPLLLWTWQGMTGRMRRPA